MRRADGVSTFHAQDGTAWRQWLEENHAQAASLWLIIYRKGSDTPSVYYDEAVDEALCFGWIDSKPNKRDYESYYQFFSRRNPKSNWSRVNKNKVEKLMAEHRMAPAGLEMVEVAQQSGTWTALDDVENLVIPPDLQAAFEENKNASNHWNNFPPSSQRGILEWIFNAKRPATRQQRIDETVTMAAQGLRANHYRQPKGTSQKTKS
ncbi:MAG: YdeI/OmpD-associated family protein [Tunicatimonas sp.]